MSKIIICGLNGSGKTTLGKELSKKINYIHKDIEDYYFVDDSEYKYKQASTKDAVIKSLEKDFKKYENIVFTACKGDYGNLNNLYDLAIYIKLDKDTRLKRIKRRSFKQFGEKVLENGILYERESKFWNKAYNKDEAEIEDWLNSLKCPKFEIDGMKSTKENILTILDKSNGVLDLEDFLLEIKH